MTEWRDNPTELDLVYEDLHKAQEEIKFLTHVNGVLLKRVADLTIELEELRVAVKSTERLAAIKERFGL